jgi:ankyrin repeat protein
LTKLLKNTRFLRHLNDTDRATGERLLHVAVKCQQSEMVEYLLELPDGGEAVNVLDAEGYTPLHIASLTTDVHDFSVHKRILLTLLANRVTNVNARTYEGRTALHFFCAKYGSPGDVEEVLSAFLARQPDINAQDAPREETPLHDAVLNPRLRGMLVRLLCFGGADVNARSLRGTPLHYAIMMDRHDLCLELLTRGANVTAQDSQGRDPVTLCHAMRCSAEVEKLLVNATEVCYFRDPQFHFPHE